jgi:hypothetical protein
MAALSRVPEWAERPLAQPGQRAWKKQERSPNAPR